MNSGQRIAVLIGALMLAAVLAAKLLAGEALTTRRVDDAIHYRTACHAEEDILHMGRDESPYELGNVLIEQGKCFILPRPAHAVLVRWIAGPFVMPEGIQTSAWEILDQFGDTEFLLMQNLGGPHEAQRDAS